jgi:hypothetical protein
MVSGMRLDDELVFFSHSVWKTPEGNIVDVCLRDAVTRDALPFAPLDEYHPNKDWFIPPPNIVFQSTGKITAFYEGCEKWVLSNKQMKKRRNTMRDAFLIYENKPVPKHLFGDGRFTKPSTATGKYFALRDAA